MVEDVKLCSVCGEYDYGCTCGGEDWQARALAAEKEASDLRAEVEGLTAERDHYRVRMNNAVAKLVKVGELCEDEQRIPERRKLIVLHAILAILDSAPMVARMTVDDDGYLLLNGEAVGRLDPLMTTRDVMGDFVSPGDRLLIVKEEP